MQFLMQGPMCQAIDLKACTGTLSQTRSANIVNASMPLNMAPLQPSMWWDVRDATVALTILAAALAMKCDKSYCHLLS